MFEFIFAIVVFNFHPSLRQKDMPLLAFQSEKQFLF